MQFTNLFLALILSCTAFPGKTKAVHHGFDDPPKLTENALDENEALTHYRRVRDEIRMFVVTFPKKSCKRYFGV